MKLIQLKLGLLFFAIISTGAGRAENLECLDGLVIEYLSPVSNEKIKSCQIKKDGKYIKHGDTFYFSPDGKFLRSEYYQHDVLKKKRKASSGNTPSKLELGI